MPAARQTSRCPSMALAVRAMIRRRGPASSRWPRGRESDGSPPNVQFRHEAVHQDRVEARPHHRRHRFNACRGRLHLVSQLFNIAVASLRLTG